MSEVNTAVILAAGLGSRLKDRTKEKPKAFLEIENRSLIERSIDHLLDKGITKIIIGTGYLPRHFERLKDKYPMLITFKNEKYAETGSMYTLYNLRHLIDKSFLLLESDLLYEREALNKLLVAPEKDIVLASGKTNSNDEVYIEADKNNHLINMSKNADELNSIAGELVGINKVSVDTFRRMCQYAHEQYQKGYFGLHYEYDLVGICTSTPIHILKIEDLAWCEIDDENHLTRALNIILPRIKKRDNS